MKHSGGHPTGPFAWGLVGTVIIVFLVVGYMISGGTEDSVSRFAMIMAGDPNEFGDTLAGLAGSLALLWIIVTAWHQSVELREQRRIIEEQKDESAAQRIATQQMATALGTQARIYEDEMQARQEAKAKEEFRELLASLRTGFERAGEITWRVRSRRAADPEQVVDKAITLEALVDRS